MNTEQNSLTRLDASAIADAIEYGIDIALLESNLARSYEERLERHEAAFILATELKRAGEQLYKA